MGSVNGGAAVSTEERTDEQHERLEPIKNDPLLRLILSTYLGDTCQGCGQTFNTLQDMKDSVWWPHEKGRIGHRRCFEAARKEAQP
jgi:hypothetical protein